MIRAVKVFLVVLVVFLLLDSLWIHFFVKPLYQAELGHLLLMHQGQLQVRPVPAILTYCCLVFAVVYFAVWRQSSLKAVSLRGALIGLVCYGTYDLTSYSLFRDWTAWLAGTDIAWGMFVCCISAMVAWSVVKRGADA
jgi:uncharacterized membrane protein